MQGAGFRGLNMIQESRSLFRHLQGYLAHKTPPPVGSYNSPIA